MSLADSSCRPMHSLDRIPFRVDLVIPLDGSAFHRQRSIGKVGEHRNAIKPHTANDPAQNIVSHVDRFWHVTPRSFCKIFLLHNCRGSDGRRFGATVSNGRGANFNDGAWRHLARYFVSGLRITRSCQKNVEITNSRYPMKSHKTLPEAKRKLAVYREAYAAAVSFLSEIELRALAKQVAVIRRRRGE